MLNARSAFLFAVAAAVACSHAKPAKEVVWPDPPEKPRIKFVRSFASGADLREQNTWEGLKRIFVGSGESDSVVQPMGLAISEDGQRLYITDLRAAAVLVADFKARTLERFAPERPFGTPFNVALDADENVYVSDSLGRSVQVFNRRGEVLRAFGKDLERPTGLALDRTRRILYVVDSSRPDSQNHRVLAYDLKGNFLRTVGGTRGDAEGDFNFPTYIALDKSGNVYVNDSMNFRIQVFDPEGRFLRAFGEHGETPGTFSRTKGIAFDGFGNLYVADGDHAVVQIFNKELQPLMFFGGHAPLVEYFELPTAVAIDPKQNLIYVGNEHTSRINVYQLVNTSAEDAVPPPGWKPVEEEAERR